MVFGKSNGSASKEAVDVARDLLDDLPFRSNAIDAIRSI